MELVSACLVGVKCRYNAKDRYDPELALRFAKGELFPFCPELLGGLSLPRRPSELQGGTGAEALGGRARVVDDQGRDVTEAFVKGAEASLELARAVGATEAYLAERSPSCGVGEVYDGGFSGAVVPGDGIAAALLARAGLRTIRVDRRRSGGLDGRAGEDSRPGERAASPVTRYATEQDCAALARLAGQLGYPCSEDDVRTRAARYFGSEERTIIAADSGGELVGWTSVEIVEHFYVERFAELSGFIVDERYRGMGTGSLMMGAAEAWARDRGLGLLRLKTNVLRSGAHRFYEALGFECRKEQYVYEKRLDR
jgi:Uncharacterized conserved protein